MFKNTLKQKAWEVGLRHKDSVVNEVKMGKISFNQFLRVTVGEREGTINGEFTGGGAGKGRGQCTSLSDM